MYSKFLDAFSSRSWAVLQPRHVQVLSASVSASLISPQHEQILLEGKNLSATWTSQSYHFPL